MEECPCNDNCLVRAACSQYCILAYQFMNNIAEQMPFAKADEIHKYRKTTPVKMLHEIASLMKNGQRFNLTYREEFWPIKTPKIYGVGSE